MIKLCECGCGNPAPISKVTNRKLGWVKGQPKRFVRGHARKNKRSPDAPELTGKTFGRWTVIADAGNVPHGAHFWLCRCECGTEKTVAERHLIEGRSESCGCLQRELAAKMNLTHGLSDHPMRAAYYQMISRCYNPNNVGFDNYGNRGIEVCDRWRESFQNFLNDMGVRPDGHTLDRIDNDGPYSPENCRWATIAEQCNNTRANHVLTLDGESMTITQWARKLGIHPNTIRNRIRSGWDTRRTLTEPVNPNPRHKSSK